MTPASRHLVRCLVCCACLALLVACTGSTDANDAAVDGTAPAAADATDSATSGLPPLPDTATDAGTLPRTYGGFTLGDPLPANAETLDDPPPFYPEATQHLVRLSESPKTNVSLYVHDGKIFRIEWRVKDASIDRATVADAFAKRLGPPDEPSEYLPKTNHTYWSDGLTDGSTTITLFRLADSEWFRVSFEDTGRVAQLMGRR